MASLGGWRAGAAASDFLRRACGGWLFLLRGASRPHGLRLMLWCQHALERAAERVGITPDLAEQQRIFLAICTGMALLLRRNGSGREEYAVTIHSVPARILYEPRIAVVVTVLPGFVGPRT